jgi:hypothetical protein
MTAILKWSLAGLESGIWTNEWDTSINPAKPAAFVIQQLPGEILLTCAGGPKFAGALAKHVEKLPLQSTSITFAFAVRFSVDIAFGQVLETDMKLTDAAGWTYDGSFQLNLAEDWMGQIGNPWIDIGLRFPLVPDQWNLMSIDYQIDYAAHTLKVVAVNGQPVNKAAIPAKLAGWAKGELVTQLQLCTTASAGAYTARFSQIRYSGNL